MIKEIFDEFPELEGKVAGGVIAKAVNPFDEGSYLTKGMNQETGQKRIVVKLLSDRFQEIPYLKKLVRHELMHASDMLSESYGYRDERLGGNPMEESIVKERYSTFWDIFVDGRLIRNGRETISDKESRYREFESLYKKIPDEVKIAVFDVLWQEESLTHDKILGLAKDVNEVIKISDGLPVGQILKKKKTSFLALNVRYVNFVLTIGWKILNKMLTLWMLSKGFSQLGTGRRRVWAMYRGLQGKNHCLLISYYR